MLRQRGGTAMRGIYRQADYASGGAMIELLQGDSLDVLPTLAAESVQRVATSPPYYGLRS